MRKKYEAENNLNYVNIKKKKKKKNFNLLL